MLTFAARSAGGDHRRGQPRVDGKPRKKFSWPLAERKILLTFALPSERRPPKPAGLREKKKNFTLFLAEKGVLLTFAAGLGESLTA